MFETGIRQFRLAMSMIWGTRINPRNVERLIGDALSTLREFGEPGDDVQQLLEGPFSDPAARKEFQNHALQRTIKRAIHTSPYYKKQYASLNINPDKITVDQMLELPITVKKDLQEHSQELIATDSKPYITTRTTGTTGQPVEIWLSKYEYELWPAMGALSGLLRKEIGPQDYLQLNISSRATIAVQQAVTACRLLGTRIRVLGTIPPDESLDNLLGSEQEAPTLMTTYPSYLAQLIKAARKRRLGPQDFQLRRIDCGGELLSRAVAQAAEDTFGAPANDTYGMTEILPVGGRVCNQGHLHHDINMGFVEVIDLQSGKPVEAGEIGTLVITPYYPYRECMPVIRYDTRDIVRRLADERLFCNLAAIPATSHILGKASQLQTLKNQIVTPREIVEICEALPAEPWPLRYQTQVVDDHLELTLPESALEGTSPKEVERKFRAAGIEAQLISRLESRHNESQLRLLRADLLETTFAARRV